MLRIVTGPFHPTLEQALIHRVRDIKCHDPLASLLLVVPSEPLRRHIQWLLAHQPDLPLLNVHFLTFYQFAQRLLEEPTQDSNSIQPLHITPATLFNEIIHHFLRSHLPHRSQLHRLVEMPGAWAAIWSTFKDLKDAGVSSETEAILEVLSHKVEFLNETRDDVLADLLHLYATFKQELDRHNIGDYEDLSVRAKEQVSTSRFLQAQQEILYYGFYDLTQLQLDLFHQVVREYPSRCFFPLLHGDPSYLFAERFFDRYVRGLATGDTVSSAVVGFSSKNLPSHSNCRIFNVRGHTQEVEVVAKEILGLVEEQGYAFHEIGIIARTLSGYEHILPPIFSQHHIPFHSSIGQSLSNYPFVKALMHLLEIRVSGFRADPVFQLLSSPFSRKTTLTPRHESYPGTFRLDHWQSIQERLGIKDGLEDWKRLEPFHQSGFPLGFTKSENQEPPSLSGDQIQWVSEAIHVLHENLDSLTENGTWATFVDALTRCMYQFLDPLFMETSITTHYSPQDVLANVSNSLEELKVLDLFVEDVTLLEFSDAVTRILEKTILSTDTLPCQGVHVLDAMEARGVSFRKVFILGLNEAVFPRHIQEDAFLRDNERRALEADLGYKISEKMGGYYEEQLLFTLLTSSAQQDLTLLYLRSDDEGRSLIPSSYLDEFKQARGDLTEIIVPSSVAHKIQQGLPYTKGRSTPQEYLVEALLNKNIPSLFLKTVHPQGAWLTHCLEILRILDTHAPMGIFDGITGPIETFWEKSRARGFSPTSLERYTTCPFQYFSRHVLQLDPVSENNLTMQVEPKNVGLLIHSILRMTMEALQSEGFFKKKGEGISNPNHTLDRMAVKGFKQFSEFHCTGFPLLWELMQEELLIFLKQVLKQDLEALKKEAWEPVFFEKEMTGTLNVEGGTSSETIRIRGFLDRIDKSVNGNSYRIIDYKYKVSRNPGTLDKNLELAAIRGIHLQPPLYLKMMQDHEGNVMKGEVLEDGPSKYSGVWFYYLAPHWKENQWLFPVEFSGDGWQSPLGPALNKTIHHIINGIKQGNFFIIPGGQCDVCDYRLLCRNNHQPTLARTRLDLRRIQHVQGLKKAQLP